VRAKGLRLAALADTVHPPHEREDGSMTMTPHEALQQALKEQGRTAAWLAEQTGFSYSYVSKVLNGHADITSHFREKFALALDTIDSVSLETYIGRTVRVPTIVVRTPPSEFPAGTTESIYKEAWLQSWERQYGVAVLSAASAEAWERHQALNQALRAARG
jgi:DNA-binding LacI/PurR family transcriptional regulator